MDNDKKSKFNKTKTVLDRTIAILALILVIALIVMFV